MVAGRPVGAPDTWACGSGAKGGEVHAGGCAMVTGGHAVGAAGAARAAEGLGLRLWVRGPCCQCADGCCSSLCPSCHPSPCSSCHGPARPQVARCPKPCPATPPHDSYSPCSCCSKDCSYCAHCPCCSTCTLCLIITEWLCRTRAPPPPCPPSPTPSPCRMGEGCRPGKLTGACMGCMGEVCMEASWRCSTACKHAQGRHMSMGTNMQIRSRWARVQMNAGDR